MWNRCCASSNRRSGGSISRQESRGSPMSDSSQKIGLIAGNGKFPLLVLDAARSQGLQVKHKQIFSNIKADWKLAKLLLSLTTRNTDSLIGAISKVLAEEGITLM